MTTAACQQQRANNASVTAGDIVTDCAKLAIGLIISDIALGSIGTHAITVDFHQYHSGVAHAEQ